MARWTPDPTFYPSARQAMRAPRERLAYAVTLNTGTNGAQRPDALCVLDVAPDSPAYGQVVGRVEMPHVGDELHHFGWNACSATLCPSSAHPHVERR
jgi:selenium-binding protein 1